MDWATSRKARYPGPFLRWSSWLLFLCWCICPRIYCCSSCFRIRSHNENRDIAAGAKHCPRYDIVKRGEHLNTLCVSDCMDLLKSLEALLASKRSRLSLARSFRSREVLKRQIHMIREKISALRSVRVL